MRPFFLLALAVLATSVANAQDERWTEVSDTLAGQSGTLYGTLTLPAADGPVPVALIIAGSGPTDRDGNQGGGGPATLRKLAHALADAGIASLRYDKRGIAASEAAAQSSADGTYSGFAADAADWVDRLQADPRFSTVSTVGHSEGALFALAAARARRADAVVSIAGLALTITATIRRQLADPARLPTPELRAAGARMIDAVEAGETVDDLPPPLNSIFPAPVQRMMHEWNRWDPAAEAAAFDGPLFVLQGTTDRQAEVDEAERLAAANPTARLLLIDGMNHVLVQDSGTLIEQSMTSYQDPDRPLDPTLVSEVTSFLLGVEPRAPAPAE